MADPISIIASISGIISIGTSLSIQLYQFIDNLQSAPSDIRELAQELNSLCSILAQIQKIISKNNGLPHQEVSVDLQDVLKSCRAKLVQLQMVVKAHEIRGGATFLSKRWKAWSWTLQEKEVTVLKTQLMAHKQTLGVTLVLCNYAGTMSVKDTTDRIEAAVKGISDMLMKNGDADTAVVRQRDNFVLQRYLSNASSRFCATSRSTPPTLGQNSLDFSDEKPFQKVQLEESESSWQHCNEGDGQDLVSEQRREQGEVEEGGNLEEEGEQKGKEPDERKALEEEKGRSLGKEKGLEEEKGSFEGKELERNFSAITTYQYPHAFDVNTSLVLPIEAGKMLVSEVPSTDGKQLLELEPSLIPQSATPLVLLPTHESQFLEPSGVFEDTRKTIERIGEDFSFIAELGHLYNESSKKRMVKLDEERGLRAERHESYTDELYADQQIHYLDLKKMDHEFKLEEADKKVKEEEEEYWTYVSEVFQKIDDRLRGEIGEFTDRYLDIVRCTPYAAAGKDRWLKSEGLKLAELLELLLELESHIEKRYEKVQAATLERDQRWKNKVVRSLYVNNNFGKMKSAEKDFRENEKKTILQFAQGKLRRTQDLMGIITKEGINRGLNEELVYIDELTKVVNSISTRLSSPPSDLTMLRREITHDYEVLKNLKEEAIAFLRIYYKGSLLVNKGTNEVKLAEVALAQSGKDILITVQKEKISADQKAEEDLQSRISLVEDDFATVEKVIKATLDKLKVLEDATVGV